MGHRRLDLPAVRRVEQNDTVDYRRRRLADVCPPPTPLFAISWIATWRRISPEADIMEAVDFLLEKRVTGALVANSNGELVGMLTEFDCLKLLTLGDAHHHDAPRGKVKDFMTLEGSDRYPATWTSHYCAGRRS